MRIDASRALGGYAAATTLALAWVALASAAAPTARFATIDAERINIREPDGTLRLVIDAARQPGIVLGKRVLPHPNRPDAGMIFYNREGIENGGLIVDGGKVGDRPTNSGSLTFDRYRQDQTLQLTSQEDGPTRLAGQRINDRPDAPMDFGAALAAAKLPEGAATTAAIRAANAILSRAASSDAIPTVPRRCSCATARAMPGCGCASSDRERRGSNSSMPPARSRGR